MAGKGGVAGETTGDRERRAVALGSLDLLLDAGEVLIRKRPFHIEIVIEASSTAGPMATFASGKSRFTAAAMMWAVE